MAFLSGFTMTVIPAKATDHFEMATVFENQDGDELARVRKEESLTLWIQLFLIILMPSNAPGEVAQAVFTDLTNASLAEAEAQRVFAATQ